MTTLTLVIDVEAVRATTGFGSEDLRGRVLKHVASRLVYFLRQGYERVEFDVLLQKNGKIGLGCAERSTCRKIGTAVVLLGDVTDVPPGLTLPTQPAMPVSTTAGGPDMMSRARVNDLFTEIMQKNGISGDTAEKVLAALADRGCAVIEVPAWMREQPTLSQSNVDVTLSFESRVQADCASDDLIDLIGELSAQAVA